VTSEAVPRRYGAPVHGVIFTSLRDFAGAAHGPQVVDEIFGDEVYLLSEAYDDDDLVKLLERAHAATGSEPDDLLHDFGVFTAQRTFTRLYPAFFANAPNAREFLLTVEKRIHELVRATVPNVSPPELDVTELGPGGVAIVYSSPRRLCVLLRGLTEGTARHYGETAAIEETSCMHRGAEACRFEVRFSAAAQSA
jgi:Haem-NO-binding